MFLKSCSILWKNFIAGEDRRNDALNPFGALIADWITDDPKLRQRIRNKEIDIDYLDYDWNLNAAK